MWDGCVVGRGAGRAGCVSIGTGRAAAGTRARRGDAPGRRGTGTDGGARAMDGGRHHGGGPVRRGAVPSWRRVMEVRLVRSEGRAEGLRAFAERERTLRATSEPEKGARRAAVRAAEVAKRQPTQELERETGNVARWKAAKAARGRGRKVAERDDVARAARENACEDAAVAVISTNINHCLSKQSQTRKKAFPLAFSLNPRRSASI